MLDWSDENIRLLKHISDEKTVEILKCIRFEAKHVGEICKECNVSRSTLYRKLKPFIERRIIVCEREESKGAGKRRYLVLNNDFRVGGLEGFLD